MEGGGGPGRDHNTINALFYVPIINVRACRVHILIYIFVSYTRTSMYDSNYFYIFIRRLLEVLLRAGTKTKLVQGAKQRRNGSSS